MPELTYCAIGNVKKFLQYWSRVEIEIKRKSGCPGLVVMGDDSCLKTKHVDLL